MCSCSYPDAVYYPVVHARLDVRIEREVSPEEVMSDYGRSRAFTEAYLYGREGNLLSALKDRNQYYQNDARHPLRDVI